MPRSACLLYIASILLLNTNLVFADSHWPSFTTIRSRLGTLAPRNLLKRANIDTNPNGTSSIWLIEDTFQGKTFFDNFFFFDFPDPTRGSVNYVNQSHAFDKRLAYVDDNNKIIMKGDNTTSLPRGTFRESVRIESNKNWNTGLWILDLDKAPWGCAVWPAFWTIGTSKDWPLAGEIDIIEGVHDNQHNQVTWHTSPGCQLNPNASFTGQIVANNNQPHLDCDGTLPGNPGCGITEWSRASYGPYFDAQGGGVYAMKWDETGIAVWSFYRAAVPQDIIDGSPKPSGWGTPVAALDPSGCDPLKYFANHAVIFDITFCGDWAGNSYATSGCPGTCPDRLMDPTNFDNAIWIINSLKVYKKTSLSIRPSNTATRLDGYWTALVVSVLSMMRVVFW